MTPFRLAVWGDPIAHSKSPALHAAAYGVLGLEWEYGRSQVDVDGFASELNALDESWRGLSLTMPLKESAFHAADATDSHAMSTGAVNTLLLGDRLLGFNTDVGGIVDALSEHAITQIESVRILGAGATAASALVAARELGVVRADIRARNPDRAAGLLALGEHLGISVRAHSFDAQVDAADLTIATLPSGTTLPDAVVARLGAHGGPLFDAAYAPWPSALAAGWGSAPVISGLGMLLHQAVRQIRIFLHGDPLHVLADEESVLRAMRAAL